MNPSNKKQTILVWDFPVRVFHWLLVISFAGAWLTSEGEALQLIHYAFGHAACAIILFRVVWGIVGTRYARFTQFIKGPTETGQHIKSLLVGKQPLSPGHNPAGALVMIAMMILILLIGLTGYGIVKDVLGEWMSGAHEAISTLALGFVLLHVAAAIIMSFVQKENLVKSMFTGMKQGSPEQAIRYPMIFIGMGLALAYMYFFYLVVSGSLPSLTQ
jgi:cytochrome b